MRQQQESITRLALLLVVSLSMTCCSPYVHISDEALITTFNSNESTFIKLREMAFSDSGFTLISPRLVTSSLHPSSATAKAPHAGMGEERYAEYSGLFKSLGLADGVIRADDSVWFGAEARSFANGSVTKGYVYSTRELTPLVSDLDSYVPQPTSTSRRPGFVVFKLIKPSWYLYKLSDG